MYEWGYNRRQDGPVFSEDSKQSVDITPDLSSEYSVKRCVKLSPSSYQPSKRLSKDMSLESFDVDEPQ